MPMRVSFHCITHFFHLEIKEEKLEEYTQSLVKALKRTSLIKQFGQELRGYMPEYNQLKHFNADNVTKKFFEANKLALQTAKQ